MKNKRAQFFALYLVFITLFMAFAVIGLYVMQDGKTENSLVSPLVILELEDSEEVFLREEVALIESALNGASGEFRTPEFIESFRANFIAGFSLSMGEFVFPNLTLEGREIEGEAREQQGDFLENTLYPESLSYVSGEDLIFGRAKVGKEMILVGEDTSKINFPIDFSYEFEKTYLIMT